MASSLESLSVDEPASNVFPKSNILVLEDNEHSFLILGKDIMESVRAAASVDEGLSECDFSDEQPHLPSARKGKSSGKSLLQERMEKLATYQKAVLSTLRVMTQKVDSMESTLNSNGSFKKNRIESIVNETNATMRSENIDDYEEEAMLDRLNNLKYRSKRKDAPQREEITSSYNHEKLEKLAIDNRIKLATERWNHLSLESRISLYAERLEELTRKLKAAEIQNEASSAEKLELERSLAEAKTLLDDERKSRDGLSRENAALRAELDDCRAEFAEAVALLRRQNDELRQKAENEVEKCRSQEIEILRLRALDKQHVWEMNVLSDENIILTNYLRRALGETRSNA